MTKDQIDLIKSLTNHPWWTIIKQLEQEAMNKLWQSMLKVDLNNEEHLKVLRENQIYVKARKDFLENIEKQTLDIYENEIKLY
jgi:hypothetical protein